MGKGRKVPSRPVELKRWSSQKAFFGELGEDAICVWSKYPLEGKKSHRQDQALLLCNSDNQGVRFGLIQLAPNPDPALVMALEHARDIGNPMCLLDTLEQINPHGFDFEALAYFHARVHEDFARKFAAKNEALEAVLYQMMLHHRAQLPSEAREMLPHGCGCPLCEQARVALGLKEEQEHV